MNVIQGVKAILEYFAGEEQRNRLLRLRFPKEDGPKDAVLVVNTLNGREVLSRGFEFILEVLSDNARIDLNTVVGKMVTVDMVREDGTLRHFNGYVFEFALIKTDGGFAFYRMVLEPWLSYLRLRQGSAAFHKLTTVGLSAKVLGEYAKNDWRHEIKGNDPEKTYVCQHNESDFNLLHRQWESQGWHYCYEHREDGHRLRLADDSTRLPPIEGATQEIPYRSSSGSSEDDGMHAWSVSRRLGPDVVSLASFDFKAPKPERADRLSALDRSEAPRLEVYENTGTYGFADRAGGEALAQLRLDEIENARLHYEAQGNDRTAEPGKWFVLSGHFAESLPGAPADRRYLITAVHHEASNNYHVTGGAPSTYRNRVSCVPLEQEWRPGRGFNSVKPTIQGVQTAIVVGPPGEEIHTDEFGRVKVQFHWDRVGKNNELSSPWVRVASGWAGAHFGHISLPRVGMEVIVQFLDGNIDHPLITGAVYNANNMPPWDLPANKTQSGIATRSTNKGGQGDANALRFEDKRGAEELWMHAEKDQRLEVEHNETHWIGNDRSKTVDHDEKVEIKHDQNVTVHNNRTERVDQNEKVSIGGNRTEDVGANEQIDIGGNRSVVIGGHKKEQVSLTKDERVGLGKALSIGGAYQTTVGGAMNTTVVLAQLEEIGLTKTVIVGESSSLSVGTRHKIVVGTSTLIMTEGRIEIIADEIVIRGRKKVEIHGDDIDNNPGS